jgi:hypothetical protein
VHILPGFLRLRVIRSRGFTRLDTLLSEDRNRPASKTLRCCTFTGRTKSKRDCVSSGAVGWGTALQTGRSRVRFLPIPVVGRSKVYVYGRYFAGTAGSNAVEGMDVCVVEE